MIYNLITCTLEGITKECICEWFKWIQKHGKKSFLSLLSIVLKSRFNRMYVSELRKFLMNWIVCRLSMGLKNHLCLSFDSNKSWKWQNLFDLIMIQPSACYCLVDFIIHIFDLPIGNMDLTNCVIQTPLSNHCKVHTVPHATDLKVQNWWGCVTATPCLQLKDILIISENQSWIAMITRDFSLLFRCVLASL